MGKKVGPAGFEPVTWRITAQFLYGYTFELSLNTNGLKVLIRDKISSHTYCFY